jgi:hypothetical protein
MGEELTDQDAVQPPLFVVKGEASDEEIAALSVVLASLAARASQRDRTPTREWSAHRRKVRETHRFGPGAWRSSGLPR